MVKIHLLEGHHFKGGYLLIRVLFYLLIIQNVYFGSDIFAVLNLLHLYKLLLI